MRNTERSNIMILIRCLLAAALLVLPAFAAEPLAKVVVALKPDKNPEQMLAERKTFKTFLAGKLGKPVEVQIPLSSAVILEGFANGTIDVGYLSATDMLNARERKLATILLAGEIDGKPSYQSYWVALKEKPYTSVEELRARPVAFSSKTSTSGFVIPLYDLHRKGLVSAKGDPEEFFGKGNVWFGTGYVSAIERVLKGEAEAAAVSYYVLDKDKHLSAEQRARLEKVTAQGPVPTHVLAVRGTMAPADREVLLAAFDALNEPANQELRDRLFTSRLIPVNEEEHLRSIAEAMKLVRGAK